MKSNSNTIYWLLVITCIVAIIPGIFQLGYLTSLFLYSSEINLSSITFLQVGLMSLSFWGAFELSRTLKKIQRPKIGTHKINISKHD